MAEDSLYKDLSRAKNELEKKDKKLAKELKTQSILKPDADFLFSELFNKYSCCIFLQKEKTEDHPARIIMANPAAKKILGYTEEEFHKMSLPDLFDKKTVKKPSKDLQSRGLVKFEQTLLTKNHKRIPVEIHSHEFDFNGTDYTFIVIHDLTSSKNLSEALHVEEEKFKRLIENLEAEYIFYSHDMRGMTTYISPSVKKVLGYSQEEAQRNFREFLTESETNKKSRVYSELSLKGIRQPPFISELYHRDGTSRIFYNTEIPVLDESGKVIAVEGMARDITADLKSAEQLKQQEERFRLLVETIEEVFWIFDLKLDKLLYISPKYEKVYGKPIESLYANPGSFLKTLYPEDIPMVKKAYQQTQKGKGFDLEYRIKTPDGLLRWIWSRSFVIPDDKKKPALVLGTAFEITDRKNVQLDKNLLAAIVENTEDHAVIKDKNLRIIASNKANTLAAGKKTAEELIGKTDLEVYGDHPHVRQYVEDDKKAMLMKKGETLVNEQIFVYPDGRTIHSLVKKFPVFDEKNKLIAIASISRDITDYKKALQNLSESEKKFRFLIENQAEGIGVLDTQYRFTFINPGTEKIFGTEKGKMINKSLLQFVDRETGNKIRQNLKSFNDKDVVSFEIAIKKPDNKLSNIQVSATQLHQNDKPSGTFIVFNDITSWKIAEDTLMKSEKELRESNAAKDKFFSIIAHDLKNPFHSILNFSDLLLKSYSTFDKEEILTFIKMIHESSRQAFNLLDNLLHWSRAQMGKMNLNTTVVDLYNIITQNIYLLEGAAGEKNIHISHSVQPKTFILCDENMISTVFRNLMSNAIKFTRPTGKINISSHEKSHTYEILVNDTGVGIKEEDLDKLFRIDIHFSTTGTANEEGTGLGLILCQEFVNLNNGKIRVVSKPGKGSTFFVELPKAPK
jgi:two-component system sensor histidine kinase/response regulator